MKTNSDSIFRPGDSVRMDVFDHERCMKRIQRTSRVGQFLILILSLVIAYGLFA